MSQFLLSWDTKEQEHPGAIGSAYLSQQSGNSLELPGKLGKCALAQKKKKKQKPMARVSSQGKMEQIWPWGPMAP